jgi:hypothetical protein
MSKPLKTVFKTKIDDKEVELAVVLPSAKVKQHGRIVHARAYNDAVQGGAMLREELEGHLRKSKLWDDERQAEYDRLRNILLDGEKTLARKNIKLKDARKLAIDMSKARVDLQDLLAQRNRVDQNTADAIADQAQFNFFVANCTVYNDTGKPVFTFDGHACNTDAYVEKGTEQHAIDAATKLSEMMFGSDKDILEKLPENQFLKKYKFVDDSYHLVDEQGRKVDEKGRLVDQEGRFVDPQGNYVDADGVPVDADGRYIAEEDGFFLDDEGNPIKDDQQDDPQDDPQGEERPDDLLAPTFPGSNLPPPIQDDWGKENGGDQQK